VLLAFFKISCPVCQFTLPYLNRIHPGVKVYGVSQNDAEDTRDFVRHYKLAYPVLLDPEDQFPASNAFGITHVPTTFLVDAGGRITQVIEGWNKQDMQALGAVSSSDNVPAWKAG
jgi:peroxiredoxin